VTSARTVIRDPDGALGHIFIPRTDIFPATAQVRWRASEAEDGASGSLPVRRALRRALRGLGAALGRPRRRAASPATNAPDEWISAR